MEPISLNVPYKYDVKQATLKKKNIGSALCTVYANAKQ